MKEIGGIVGVLYPSLSEFAVEASSEVFRATMGTPLIVQQDTKGTFQALCSHAQCFIIYSVLPAEAMRLLHTPKAITLCGVDSPVRAAAKAAVTFRKKTRNLKPKVFSGEQMGFDVSRGTLYGIITVGFINPIFFLPRNPGLEFLKKLRR